MATWRDCQGHVSQWERSMIRTAILAVIFSTNFPVYSYAGGSLFLPEACLPPIHGSNGGSGSCSLGFYSSEPPYQKIETGECKFFFDERAAVVDDFSVIECLIHNISKQRVLFFKYGVRYMVKDSSAPLVEDGFEATHRYNSGHLVPALFPGETRPVKLIAPSFPDSMKPSELRISIEVIEVSS